MYLHGCPFHKNAQCPIRQCALTEVWHIVHFWASYGRCAMPELPMGWSEGLSRQWAAQVGQVGKTKKHAPFPCFWNACGSLSMLGSPIGAFVGLS